MPLIRNFTLIAKGGRVVSFSVTYSARGSLGFSQQAAASGATGVIS